MVWISLRYIIEELFEKVYRVVSRMEQWTVEYLSELINEYEENALILQIQLLFIKTFYCELPYLKQIRH